MPKWMTYIFARLDGACDEEANAQAGYQGQTPGDAIRRYVRVERVREQWNAWGAGGGPRSVHEDWDITRRQIRDLEARQREGEAALEDLRAYAQILEVLVAWKQRES